MERIDWNLLVLGAAGGQRFSPVQLQKSLFILSRELSSETLGAGFYQFEPYNYGPFDATAYADSRSLAEQGLAIVAPCSQGYMEYSATPAGIAATRALERELTPQTIAYVQQVVDWVRGQSFSSLVRAVYEAYPEMRVNSVFRD